MAESTLRAVVTWAEPTEGPAGVGLQDTSGGLAEGVSAPDGSVRYEVDLTLRERKVSGVQRVDFGGPFVHGPAGERFLYLSFRGSGEEPWYRRSKIILPAVDEVAGKKEIHATVADAGRSRAVLDGDGWSAT
ncbi:DUF5990 family protein [Streptomyces pinistramenti]|uniref:DUF5990 family protein n=1 Tax=Streptomyces pinistramenti TaxID=2884812 RepID=UPI001D079318|nr:DUF5990 family protein [Streptomyces pinistramenti]MCB5909691.1 DUF5990 family protein [Streptomyces pinistramenti]